MHRYRCATSSLQLCILQETCKRHIDSTRCNPSGPPAFPRKSPPLPRNTLSQYPDTCPRLFFLPFHQVCRVHTPRRCSAKSSAFPSLPSSTASPRRTLEVLAHPSACSPFSPAPLLYPLSQSHSLCLAILVQELIFGPCGSHMSSYMALEAHVWNNVVGGPCMRLIHGRQGHI